MESPQVNWEIGRLGVVDHKAEYEALKKMEGGWVKAESLLLMVAKKIELGNIVLLKVFKVCYIFPFLSDCSFKVGWCIRYAQNQPKYKIF